MRTSYTSTADPHGSFMHHTRASPHAELLSGLEELADAEQVISFLYYAMKRIDKSRPCSCLYCTGCSDNPLLVFEEAWLSKSLLPGALLITKDIGQKLMPRAEGQPAHQEIETSAENLYTDVATVLRVNSAMKSSSVQADSSQQSLAIQRVKSPSSVGNGLENTLPQPGPRLTFGATHPQAYERSRPQATHFTMSQSPTGEVLLHSNANSAGDGIPVHVQHHETRRHDAKLKRKVLDYGPEGQRAILLQEINRKSESQSASNSRTSTPGASPQKSEMPSKKDKVPTDRGGTRARGPGSRGGRGARGARGGRTGKKKDETNATKAPSSSEFATATGTHEATTQLDPALFLNTTAPGGSSTQPVVASHPATAPISAARKLPGSVQSTKSAVPSLGMERQPLTPQNSKSGIPPYTLQVSPPRGSYPPTAGDNRLQDLFSQAPTEHTQRSNNPNKGSLSSSPSVASTQKESSSQAGNSAYPPVSQLRTPPMRPSLSSQPLQLAQSPSSPQQGSPSSLTISERRQLALENFQRRLVSTSVAPQPQSYRLPTPQPSSQPQPTSSPYKPKSSPTPSATSFPATLPSATGISIGATPQRIEHFRDLGTVAPNQWPFPTLPLHMTVPNVWVDAGGVGWTKNLDDHWVRYQPRS